MRAAIIAECIVALVTVGFTGRAGAQSPPRDDPGSSGMPPSMARALLESHNAVRAQFGVPPLQWSGRLARHAREWAETLLRRNVFHHRPASPYGENLFMVAGGSCAPEEVVREWASEARHYDPRLGRCRAECGHFTQVVWRRTRAVGCGVARGRGHEIWVCNYDPPGNVAGERPY